MKNRSVNYRDCMNLSDYQDFVDKNRDWLVDYSLLCRAKIISVELNGCPGMRTYDSVKSALEYYRQLLKEKIEFWCFVQYKFLSSGMR